MVLFTLNDQEFECKPNFDFIERVEQRFTLLEFLHDTTNANIKISRVAWVIYCALKANEYDATYNDVGEDVRQDLAEANLAAIDLVSSSLQGNPKKEIKKKKQGKPIVGPVSETSTE